MLMQLDEVVPPALAQIHHCHYVHSLYYGLADYFMILVANEVY